MKVHVLDGTYELFRHYFAVPSHITVDGHEVAAIRGVLESVLNLLSERDVTHLGVATDHIIESFRNALYAGYKTGATRPDFSPAVSACSFPREQVAGCGGQVPTTANCRGTTIIERIP